MAGATAFYEWLSQPRVRLAVIGVILLVIGGLIMTDSVWTLPLVVVGALMVAIAWIGCRLDGRFAVEWGESGTQLEFRAKIRAPEPAGSAQARAPARPHAPAISHQPARAIEPAPAPAIEPPPANTDVIDGDAHTVEIDVAELEALIAAVEASGSEITQADPSVRAERRFRVARAHARSSETGR